jgi:hypothetical protein
MSKNYPILLHMDQMTQVLADALDAIGAYSLHNPAWAAVAGEAGRPVPPPPPADFGAPHLHAAGEVAYEVAATRQAGSGPGGGGG